MTVEAETRPVGRFLVLCEVDQDRLSELNELRPRHLEHVELHSSRIAFGGVLGPAGPPRGVCYVLDVDERSEAAAFVAADPYAELYTSVRIEEFGQRLPVPAHTTGDSE